MSDSKAPCDFYTTTTFTVVKIQMTSPNPHTDIDQD